MLSIQNVTNRSCDDRSQLYFYLMKSQKNSWNKFAQRTEIDNNIYKFEEALFCYTSTKKYIQLTQQRTEHQMYYTDISNPGFSPPVVTSFVLDQALSIVEKNKGLKPNLQEKLKEKYKDQNNQFQLSYLHQKYEMPEPALDPLPYKRYYELNDFQIGRLGYGRNIQSYKIQSDSISRDHCEFIRIKNCNKKSMDHQKIIERAFRNGTPMSSLCRKIPRDVLEKVFQYIRPKQKYLIRDLGSRNGTFIYEVGTKLVELRPNFDYQIDGESYGIHIKQIFTSADTPNQTILEHNGRVSKMIDQFMKEVSWCYYQSAKKSLLLPDKNIKDNNTAKFSVLVFKLKTKDPHQYYFIGINENSEKRFSIGCYQDIDIYPEEFENPSLYAMLVFKQGKWKIEAVPFQQINMMDLSREETFKKIWVSPPKATPYIFNTSKQYKIKLGNTARFSLQFNNFDLKQ